MTKKRTTPPLLQKDVDRALRAFWHRTRAIEVPLTAEEWLQRTGMADAFLIRVCRNNFVRPAHTNRNQAKGRVRIYELTERGSGRLREILQA